MQRWPGAVVAAVVTMAVFPALPCAAQSGSAPSSEDREVFGGIAVWRSSPYSRRHPPDSTIVQAFAGFSGARWIHDRLGVSGLFGFAGRREVFFMVGARTRFFLSGDNTLGLGFNYALGGSLVPEVLFGHRLSRGRAVKIFGVGVAGIVHGEDGFRGIYPTIRLGF